MRRKTERVVRGVGVCHPTEGGGRGSVCNCRVCLKDTNEETRVRHKGMGLDKRNNMIVDFNM